MVIFESESYAKVGSEAMRCGSWFSRAPSQIAYRSFTANAARYSITGRVLQHLVPFALVFEHDFAEETNGRHAMAEQFVVEFLQ